MKTSTIYSQEAEEWRRECIKCRIICADLNELRKHRERIHGICAYCVTSDLSLDHVIKKHRVCVFCHQLGIYAPVMSSGTHEIKHILKYHPRTPRVLLSVAIT